MGVDARMQQKEQQSEQGQPAAAGHPPGQQRSEESADDEEEMSQYIAQPVDAAAVLQPQRPFRHQQRQLESHPILPVYIGQ